MVSSPWTTLILAVIALALLAIHIWGVHQGSLPVAPPHWPHNRVEPYFDFGPQHDHGPGLHHLLEQVQELQRDLDTAHRTIAMLQAQKEKVERDLRAARTTARKGRTDALYARVGLDRDAPDWLVTASRRAHRSYWHPDRHPSPGKAEAEREFKDAEGVFSQIYRQRGMAG
jgi:hypothetical protein